MQGRRATGVRGAAKSYDVVVVGSGSAGAVLAHRLAATGSLRVCLIEAGGRGGNPLYKVPLLAGTLFRMRAGNWNYTAEPSPGMNGRGMAWPRGKVLGGTSMINGMVYLRGLPSDYDGWAAEGLPEWSWNNIAADYERSVRFLYEGSADSGVATTPISRVGGGNPLFRAFINACRQAGWPWTDNLNRDPYGVGYYDFTQKDGERWSTSRTFLARDVKPANLDVLVHTRAVRLVMEKGRVLGVDVLRKGRPERILAGEVVLSGGAINTPSLLMQSGIGGADVLSEADIATLHDLPGVGRNLQDHLLVRVEYSCTKPLTLHNLMRPDRAGLALMQALMFRTGPATSFPIEVGAFIKSRDGLAGPDIQSHFLPGLSTTNLRGPFGNRARSRLGHGFFASACKMRPESRGYLLPAGDDPLAAPRIFPCYLSDERDVVTLRDGVRRVREIFAQSAFDDYRGVELLPGAAIDDDAGLDRYVRETAGTVFHPVGTCRMGNDGHAVVDGRLRVHGIEGLRIADASVMPRITSANTHAPTMMIGERAATLMKEDLGLN